MAISASIDESKINEAWKITGKTGKKYLSLEIYVNDQPDKYGNDVIIKQTVPKELRAEMKARGERSPIIGNGRNWDKQNGLQNQKHVTMNPPKNNENLNEDVPF